MIDIGITITNMDVLGDITPGNSLLTEDGGYIETETGGDILKE